MRIKYIDDEDPEFDSIRIIDLTHRTIGMNFILPLF